MRIGLDAMGGDGAPAVEVRGALAAREYLAADDRIVLVGDKEQILPHLQDAGDWQSFVEVHHAGDVIGMDDAPVEAIRSKPDSSLAVLANLHRTGEVDALISAGNTGACVAAAQMRLHRLRGVHRPGIAIVTPTPSGPVAVCDVGANVNCRPQHLHQYGVMAGLFLKATYGVENSRVGLLSVGEEDAKGNELVKRTRQLLKNDSNVNFVGNVEGRDLFRGVCDVMVCEGFVGNVILKLIEGMAEVVVRSMVDEVRKMLPPGAEGMVKGAVSGMLSKYDFNEYGGAPLLGVGGICIICHGASSHRGIMNAVRGAISFSRHGVNEQITLQLSEGSK